MRDTGTLTMLEHGAYRILLDHYYCEEELPNDNARLYHLCRATTPEERKSVDYIVKKFFAVSGDRLINSRADKEIILRREFLSKQSAKGKRSAEVRSFNRGSTVVQPDANLSSPSPSPLPSLSPEPKDQSQRMATITPVARARKVFVKPTLEEVRCYCASRGNGIDPQMFIDSNEAKGWVVGDTHTPMKDWKATIRTWEARNGPGTKGKHGERTSDGGPKATTGKYDSIKTIVAEAK